MRFQYAALIGAPTPGTDEGWQAVVPQIPMCFSLGYSHDDAVAMIKECLVLTLEGNFEAQGGAFIGRPIEECQEAIGTVEDGGPEWERIVVEVDFDEFKELSENKAAYTIQKFFCSKFGPRLLPLTASTRYVVHVYEQDDSAMDFVYDYAGELWMGARGDYTNVEPYEPSDDETDENTEGDEDNESGTDEYDISAGVYAFVKQSLDRSK
ncbi:MAG: hypothetical protein SGARI_007195 [Bacillariaceae sp.]